MTTSTQVNDIETVESKFFSSLGNGIQAAEHLQTMVLSVVQSRDTTILTHAMHRADTKKNDAGAVRAIRTVAGAVWPGAKKGKTKDGKPTIKIKGIKADKAALARLAGAVERKLSIRHGTFLKTVKGAGASDRVVKPAPERALNFAKSHTSAELEQKITETRAMLAALESVRGKTKDAKATEVVEMPTVAPAKAAPQADAPKDTRQTDVTAH